MSAGRTKVLGSASRWGRAELSMVLKVCLLGVSGSPPGTLGPLGAGRGPLGLPRPDARPTAGAALKRGTIGCGAPGRQWGRLRSS